MLDIPQLLIVAIQQVSSAMADVAESPNIYHQA